MRTSPEMQRFNQLIEAFDRVTCFQFDRVTDPDLLIRLMWVLYGPRPAANLALAAEKLRYPVTIRLAA